MSHDFKQTDTNIGTLIGSFANQSYEFAGQSIKKYTKLELARDKVHNILDYVPQGWDVFGDCKFFQMDPKRSAIYLESLNIESLNNDNRLDFFISTIHEIGHANDSINRKIGYQTINKAYQSVFERENAKMEHLDFIINFEYKAWEFLIEISPEFNFSNTTKDLMKSDITNSIDDYAKILFGYKEHPNSVLQSISINQVMDLETESANYIQQHKDWINRNLNF